MGWKVLRDCSQVVNQMSICCSRLSRHRSKRAYQPLTPFCNVPTNPTGRLSLFEDVSQRTDGKGPLLAQKHTCFLEPKPPLFDPIQEGGELAV